MSFLLALGFVALVKGVLVGLLAVLNAVLALLASVAVWKTYLAVGTKLVLIALVCVPILGLVFFAVWGQKRVRAAQR